MSAKVVTEEIVTSAFELEEELAASLAAEIQRGGVVAPDRAASDARVLVEHLRRIGGGGGPDGRTTLLERGLALACDRGAGKPLAHVLGAAKFLGRWFAVDTRILAPHPATEVLVALACHALDRRPSPPAIGIEIGFGCGVITISLLARYPTLCMLGTDLSEAEREVAEENARALLTGGSDRFRALLPLHPGEVMAPFLRAGVEHETVDLLVTNPPYLVESDDISDEYRLHMPAAALYAPGGDPLHVYREIAAEGTALLRPGGLVVAELRASRADTIAALFAARGYDVEVWSKGDVDRDVDLSALAPHDRSRKLSNHRFLVARRPEPSIAVARADGEERE